MIDKINQYLCYSDEFIWHFALNKCKPLILEKYILKIGECQFPKPVCGIIHWSDTTCYANIINTVKMCIKNNIELIFTHNPKIVVQKLMHSDDLQICDYLMCKFPQFHHLSEEWILTFVGEMGIYLDITYLSVAVANSAFKCLLKIINSSPCFNEFHIPYSTDCGNINEMLDEDHFELSLEYELDKFDIHLLAFARRQNDSMFDAILSLYRIRQHWFQIIQTRTSRIQGFEWSSFGLLINPLLTFLIWLGKIKLGGLPKLLIYTCIYPHVF